MVVLLLEEFVSTQLHQDVCKSNCSGVLGQVHPVHILFCFVLTQLGRVLQPHQLTCTTDRAKSRGFGLKMVVN